VIGRGATVGRPCWPTRRVPLVSATGSCRRWGTGWAGFVTSGWAGTILELGGNNAIVVTAHANLNLAVPAILFGAVGTAGQRCTSTRRIIVHESVEGELVSRLSKAYAQVRIGQPAGAADADGPAHRPGGR